MKMIAIDFDGTLHSYESGWQGATVIPDPPVPGAIDFLNRLAAHPDLTAAIFSARVETHEAEKAIRRWLYRHGTDRTLARSMLITNVKPPQASLLIDDRGFHFRGEWPSIEFLLEFEPWNS